MHDIYFSFKRTSGKLNQEPIIKFKGLPAIDDARATHKYQAITTLLDLLEIFRTFYQRNLRLSFLD